MCEIVLGKLSIIPWLFSVHLRGNKVHIVEIKNVSTSHSIVLVLLGQMPKHQKVCGMRLGGE